MSDILSESADQTQPEPVKQIYDNWGNRASLKEPDCLVEGGRVFKVGGYSITVPNDPDEPAKVSSLYNRWGASENPMPNMSFSEGEMRIPVEDFADLILRRVPAEELAEGLWRDDGVRDRFIECMANRYSGPIEDADRRKLLNRIQVQIYAKAIDRAIERLNHSETGERSRVDYYRFKQIELGHYRGIYDFALGLIAEDLEALSCFQTRFTSPEKLAEFFKDSRDPAAVESVGPSWYESRDYWRKRLEDFFPEPTVPEAAPAEQDGIL